VENDELCAVRRGEGGVELVNAETAGVVILRQNLRQKETNGIYIFFQGQADA